MTTENLQFTIITILIAVVGYFLKKTLDKIEVIHTDVSDIKPKVDILWKDKLAPASSPRQLNDRGTNILNDSGIKTIVDEKKDELVILVKAKEAKNPYDAELAISSVMMELPSHCPDVTDRLKQGAFQSGVDVNTVLYVGSIYLRNLIFSELGFSLDDLDRVKVV
ncbi:MAG: hypothetical protein WCO16_02330 [bacterium]